MPGTEKKQDNSVDNLTLSFSKASLKKSQRFTENLSEEMKKVVKNPEGKRIRTNSDADEPQALDNSVDFYHNQGGNWGHFVRASSEDNIITKTKPSTTEDSAPKEPPTKRYRSF